MRHLGIALGGRPAQALAGRLLLPVSKDTFLRGVRRAADRLAILRRGQHYGTLICDLERRCVIDLLPDREPATVEAWLRHHPEIEVVAHDRNGGYGGAVGRAMPKAVQVADRWHLLENARAAFLSAVHKVMPAIRKVLGSTVIDPALLTAAERLQYEGFQRRKLTNQVVRRRVQDGMPIKRMVRIDALIPILTEADFRWGFRLAFACD